MPIEQNEIPVVSRNSVNAYESGFLRKDFWFELPPSAVAISVNSLCNLFCEFCDIGLQNKGHRFYDRIIDRKDKFASLRQMTNLAEQMAEFTPSPRATFVHAEPLMHPNIESVVEIFASRGINTSVTTNGMLLPRKYEGLVDAGLNNLMVSIDGPKDLHDAVRGREVFGKALEGLKKIAKLKRSTGRATPRLRIQAVIYEKTADRLYEFLEFLAEQELDLSSVELQHLLYEKTVEEGRLFNLGDELFEVDPVQLKAELARIKAANFPFPINLKPEIDDAFTLDKYYHDYSYDVFPGPCEMPLTSLYVDIEGNVVLIPRCGMSNQYYGNIMEERMVDIWNGENIRVIRSYLASEKPEFCNRCCGLWLGKLGSDPKDISNYRLLKPE